MFVFTKEAEVAFEEAKVKMQEALGELGWLVFPRGESEIQFTMGHGDIKKDECDAVALVISHCAVVVGQPKKDRGPIATVAVVAYPIKPSGQEPLEKAKAILSNLWGEPIMQTDSQYSPHYRWRVLYREQ